MEAIIRSIELNLIEKDRWRYIIDGLFTTLIITFFALLIGLMLGLLVSVIRNAHEHTGKFRLLNGLSSIYLTIIRGTPVIVQLLIIYFGIFGSVRVDKILVAVLAFGINSGAYQAEIFRSGIQSVPRGQFEAGRSLGFSYYKTMKLIIVPQALKNILPALGNEFIVLIKETSVAGFIAIHDLTKGGDIIRSQTYAPFMPYLIVGAIYLILVMIFTRLVAMLERRLKRSER